MYFEKELEIHKKIFPQATPQDQLLHLCEELNEMEAEDKQSVADNKAIRDEIASIVAKNSADHETIYKELVAQREAQLVANGNMDKELAL